MGTHTQRMLRFAQAQAQAVNQAISSGDQQAALAAAAATPWQPKLSADQLSKLFSTDSGQEQVAQKIAVITKMPIESARTQVQRILATHGVPDRGVHVQAGAGSSLGTVVKIGLAGLGLAVIVRLAKRARKSA